MATLRPPCSSVSQTALHYADLVALDVKTAPKSGATSFPKARHAIHTRIGDFDILIHPGGKLVRSTTAKSSPQPLPKRRKRPPSSGRHRLLDRRLPSDPSAFPALSENPNPLRKDNIKGGAIGSAPPVLHDACLYVANSSNLQRR